MIETTGLSVLEISATAPVIVPVRKAISNPLNTAGLKNGAAPFQDKINLESVIWTRRSLLWAGPKTPAGYSTDPSIVFTPASTITMPRYCADTSTLAPITPALAVAAKANAAIRTDFIISSVTRCSGFFVLISRIQEEYTLVGLFMYRLRSSSVKPRLKCPHWLVAGEAAGRWAGPGGNSGVSSSGLAQRAAQPPGIARGSVLGAGVYEGWSTIWHWKALLPLCTMKKLRHNTCKPIRVEGTPEGRRGQRCSWDGSRGSDGIR